MFAAWMGQASAQTCAPGWTCHRVYDGDADTLVMAAVVRAWGQTDDVVLGYELRHPNAPQAPSEFLVEARRCAGPDCTAPGLPYGPAIQVGDRLLFGQPMMPSVSLWKARRRAAGAPTPLTLDVVLRDRWDEDGGFCGSATIPYADQLADTGPVGRLDLAHARWTALPGGPASAEGPWPIEATLGEGEDACEDRGLSYARTDPDTGLLRACWRWVDRAGNPDEVHCAEEVGPEDYVVDEVPAQGAHAFDQDHLALDLDAGAPLLVHRSRERVGGAVVSRVRVRFLDDPADPELILAEGPMIDAPDVAVSSSGAFTVVWQDGSGSTSTIEASSCDPAAADCTTRAGWTDSVVVTDRNVRHAQITTDGDRQFVAYMVNARVGPGDARHRVHLASRCGLEPWTVEEIHTPVDPDADQGMFWGRAHVAADRGDHVVHVTWVEADRWHGLLDQPGESDAWWASRPYEPCP